MQQLERAERVQRDACASFSVPTLSPQDRAQALEAERRKQACRERMAIEKMEGKISCGGGVVNEQNCLVLLNQMCKATKVNLVEVPRGGECRLRYESVLRKHEGIGHGNKKEAKRKAAMELLGTIRAGMRQKT